MCMTVGHSEGEKGVGKDCLQFTAINERTVQTLKASSADKKCFERIPCDSEGFEHDIMH